MKVLLTLIGTTIALSSFADDLTVVVTPAAGTTSTGAVDLTVSGGVAPFTYSWSGPGAFSASTEDITALPTGTYTVTVTDAFCGVAVLTVTVDSTSVSGIEELSSEGNLFVYPNPTSDYVTIQIKSDNVSGSISLINTSGQTVMIKENLSENKVILDISALPSGVYFIQVKNNGVVTRARSRIVKQ